MTVKIVTVQEGEESVSRERLIHLIQRTDLFSQEEHRRHALTLLSSYIREVRTRHIRQLFLHTTQYLHIYHKG